MGIPLVRGLLSSLSVVRYVSAIPWIGMGAAALYVWKPWATAAAAVQPAVDQVQSFAHDYSLWILGGFAIWAASSLFGFARRGVRRVSGFVSQRTGNREDRALLQAAGSDEAVSGFQRTVLDSTSTTHDEATAQANARWQAEVGQYQASRKSLDDQGALLDFRRDYLAGLAATYRFYGSSFRRLMDTAKGDQLRRLSNLSAYALRRATFIAQRLAACEDSAAALRRGQDQRGAIAEFLKTAGVDVA